MSHPFGDLLSQHLHRKHGLSQSKLAEGILQAPTIITGMCKGRRLTGPQARERVIAIIGWLEQQSVLKTLVEANALLNAAGMAPLQKYELTEAALLRTLLDPPVLSEQIDADDAGVFTLPMHAPQETLSRHPSVNHNIPAQLTPFVGRTAELADLTSLLTNSDVRLITLLGAGGIGKTRLAQAIALQQVEYFHHGVYFISLAGIDSASAIISLIADVLTFSFSAGRTPHQQLCDYLRHKNMLLVLDNFEHFIDPIIDSTIDRGTRLGARSPDELNGVHLLLDLLHAAPQLHLLVTSRVRLNVEGEQLYAIDGLNFPQTDPITRMAAIQTSAVDLFVRSARRVQANFTLTDDNAAAVGHICRLVQGMPLAILLAAAWVELLAPSEILTELSQSDNIHQNLDFLATELQNVPARQRSMRVVFDHSWRLLSTPEQMLFAQLSLFRGGFSHTAAQAVTGATPRALMKLVNKSIVRRQATGRYELHELIRQYAAEQLAQTAALGAPACDQHSCFYCMLLGEQTARLQGAEQQEAIWQIELELDNMRSAWQWAAEHKQHEQLAQAMHSLGLFYQWRSRYLEGEAVYSYAVRHLKRSQHQSPTMQRVLAQALTWQSIFTRSLGRLVEAHHLLRQSQVILESITPSDPDVQRAKAFTFLQMGSLDEAQAAFATGRQSYQHALALYQTLDDGWGRGFALAGLGEISYRSGHLQRARSWFEESLALHQMAGDQRNSAHILERLSYILRDQGQLADAEALTTKSLALYAVLGDRVKLAAGYYALAWSSIYAGRFGEALVQVEKYIVIRTDLGLPTSLNLPGLINLELGNYAEARTQLEVQLHRSRASNDKDELSLGLDVLTCLAIVEARYVDAQALVTEALALHQEIGELARLAHAQAFAGYAARGLGQRAAARHYFFQALQSTDIHDGFLTLLFVLPGIALLLADDGESERSIEIYVQIADAPLVANSRMRWDLVGAHLAKVAATLPPEVVAAVHTRGKGGDLWSTAAALLVELGQRGWEGV